MKIPSTFLFLVSFFILMSPLAAEEASVEIISLSGTVEVCKSGETEYKAAEEGLSLGTGDSIKTKEGSYADLAFDEESENVVRVNANTAAVVLLKKSEKIELADGEAYSTINKLSSGSAFEIRTPTAVTGARGTEWTTKVEEGETIVEAFEAAPYVKSIEKDGSVSKEETLLSAGYKTRVRRFEAPARPERLTAAERGRWKSQKGQIMKNVEGARLRKRMNPAGLKKPGMPDGAKGERRSERFEGPKERPRRPSAGEASVNAKMPDPSQSNKRPGRINKIAPRRGR